MRLTALEIRHIRLPLVAPFETSFGREDDKVAVLVRAIGQLPDGTELEGWGECVAMEAPVYSAEFVAGVDLVIRHFLAPALFAAGDRVTAERVSGLLAGTVGHPMAKAAVEMAVLDAELRGRGLSLAEFLGATRSTVPSGVSVGIQPSIEKTLEVVGEYLDQGYARIKLKIKPG